MINKKFLTLTLISIFQSILGARFFSEHPAKKQLNKYRPDGIYSAQAFLALQWQIHDKVKAIIQEQEYSGTQISTKDFKAEVEDAHTIIRSLMDSTLAECNIKVDYQQSSFKKADGAVLSTKDNFLAKASLEISKVQLAASSKLSRINQEFMSKSDLLAFLKLHGGLMLNFWKNIGKWAMSHSETPEASFLNDSIIKFDYDHNSALESETKISRAQSKERFFNFVKQELSFLALELDTALKDDFMDYTKNASARAMASFFATIIKLITILGPIQSSTVLELSTESYESLYQILAKVLGELNKRFARISRFPTLNNQAKIFIWKLAYWTYNIFPYKDCLFRDENDYEITDLFWQTCKNLNQPFQVSAQRTTWPKSN